MIEKDPKSGRLCRRVPWRRPISIRHAGEEMQVIAFPARWQDAFSITHSGEEMHFHMYPSRDKKGWRDECFTLVLVGPKTFRIEAGHRDPGPTGATA